MSEDRIILPKKEKGDVLVHVDKDSRYDFYITRELVYGRAAVPVPEEFLKRFQRACEEYQACQAEMQEYYDNAQQRWHHE